MPCLCCQRLKNWQKSFYAQLDAHTGVLLSDAQTSTPHE
jgi:hypothetical protein